MDDTLRVCGIERVGNLKAQIEHRFDFQRLAINLVPERLPLQQFHGNKSSPIRLVNFVDGADVRVVQGGRSLGLPLETAESLCIVGEFFGKELEGDVAIELEVFRFVDHTHAPAAQLPQDAVMRDGVIHHRTPKRHRYYCGRAMRVKRDRMPPFQLARRKCQQSVRVGNLAREVSKVRHSLKRFAVSQKQSPSVFNLLPRSRLERKVETAR